MAVLISDTTSNCEVVQTSVLGCVRFVRVTQSFVLARRGTFVFYLNTPSALQSFQNKNQYLYTHLPETRMASKNQFVTFNNGLKCPILGFGTWKSKPGQVEDAVKFAIDAGYRHIDCAMVYDNEKEVGNAIKEKIDQGAVKREDLFITSKLWNTFHQPDYVETVVKKSLSDLKIDYLDLYLIHWPMAYKEGKLEDTLFPKENDVLIEGTGSYVETWKAMEKLVQKGLVKSIGVSNFNKRQIEDILNVATIKPVNVQVECHPYLKQKKLQEFCAQHNILLTAYSPLGSPDRPWAKPQDPSLLEDPKIVSIAEKYNKTPAQILIKYQLQSGNIVIPKSVTKSRIESNFDVWNFELKQEDIEKINDFDCNGRVLHLDWASHFKDYPFQDEY